MKNKFTRLASVMLVLTLLSTCVISGTYAKYVTTATGSDTARVAKFGVEIETWTDSLFATSYTSDTTGFDYNTVESMSVVKQNMVAPGTKNNGSISFKVTGIPEVAVEVSYELRINKNVFVPKGTHWDYTTSDDTTDTFSSVSDYYPVKFTLSQDGTEIAGCENVDLSVIQTYLQNDAKRQYVPGTNLEENVKGYTLSWKWDFEDSGIANVNQLDTLLGQVAAGVEGNPNIVTDLAFDLTISVTQID